MDTNFKSGFEKSAFVNLLGKGIRKLKGAAHSTGTTLRAIPEKIKTDYSRGLKGQSGISFSQAKKQVQTKDAIRKANETREINKIKNEAKKQKRMEAVQKAKETKMQNKQKALEAQQAATKEKATGLAKNVAIAGGGAAAGGMLASRMGDSQPDQSQYRYASAKGLDKTAGILSNIKSFGKAMMGPKGTRPGLEHRLDPDQLEQILKKVDEVKPKIGPLHVLGGSILAGMGAPIGAAIMRGTASGAKEVLNAPPSMSPQSTPEGAVFVQPTPVRPFH